MSIRKQGEGDQGAVSVGAFAEMVNGMLEGDLFGKIETGGEGTYTPSPLLFWTIRVLE